VRGNLGTGSCEEIDPRLRDAIAKSMSVRTLQG
jgi:hypothetical protein